MLKALVLWAAALSAQGQVRPEISELAGKLGHLSLVSQPYTNRGIHLKDSAALALLTGAF